MMSHRLRSILFVTLLLAEACGRPTSPPLPPASVAAAAPRVFADESFRDERPVAQATRPLAIPATAERTLANGLHLVVAERHDLPLVSFQVFVPHGVDDARAQIGSFAMDLLLRGNRDREGKTARDRLDALAATGSPWGALDSVGVQMGCRRAVLPETLAIVADALFHPTLEPQDLERVRAERLAALEKDNASAAKIEDWAVRAVLYPPGHPYRGAFRDRMTDAHSVTSAEVASFLRSHLTPNGMTLVVAGDVTLDELERALPSTLTTWKGPLAVKPPAPPRAAKLGASSPRVFFVDRPGSAETHVAVVAPSLARASDDYIPAMIYREILGGGSSSRLFRNLREEKGLTYWVSATLGAAHGPGELVAGGGVVRDKAGVAIREIMREVDRMATDLVIEDELTAAKEALLGSLRGRFATLGGTVWLLSERPVHLLPSDELAARPAKIAAVTAEDVRRIGRTYFPRQDLRVVATGDAAVVRADLEALGLGPVVAIDPTRP